MFTPQPLSADIVQAGPAGDSPEPDLSADPSVTSSASPELPEPVLPENSPQTDLDMPVETPKEPSAETPPEAVPEPEPAKNVLPFRPVGEAKPPTLTPVENSAFNELARQLSARLDNDNGDAASPTPEVTEAVVEPPAPFASEPASDTPEWLAPAEPPARGIAKRDKALLDLIPVGILIYRLDRLLYTNPAFLKRIGYDHLHALEQAGGLDA